MRPLSFPSLSTTLPAPAPFHSTTTPPPQGDLISGGAYLPRTPDNREAAGEASQPACGPVLSSLITAAAPGGLTALGGLNEETLHAHQCPHCGHPRACVVMICRGVVVKPCWECRRRGRE